MRGSKLLFILCVSIIFSLFVCIEAAADNRPDFDDSSVIIITKPQFGMSLFSTEGAKTGSLDSVLASLGIEETQSLMSIPQQSDRVSLFSVLPSGDKEIIKLTLPESGEDKVLEAVAALNNSGAVEIAEPNYYFNIDFTPNDPYYTSSSTAYNYHLSKVDAKSAWNMDIDCSGVEVAVIDTGILADHVDLSENIWTNPKETADDNKDNDENGYKDDIHGWDFACSDNEPEDTQGHGTHVSGIVSAVTNNGKGVASLAGGTGNSDGAKIVPLKFMHYKNGQYDSGGSSSEVISAINYINTMNIPIANCSFGGPYNSEAISEAITACKNTLFVCAAGNDGSAEYNYPASYGYDNTLAVAASTSSDGLAYFSNYGSQVEIAAPGYMIYSTAYSSSGTSEYKSMSGTSQATPLVASAAAVIKAKYPDMTPSELKTALIKGSEYISTLTYTETKSSTDSEGNTTTTEILHTIGESGRLNVYRSLLYASGDYHVVTWRDSEGNLVDKTLVENGTIPTHAPINKEQDDEYIYEFKGWEPEITEATSDADYTAIFEKIALYCTVTWKNYDGTVLSQRKFKAYTYPFFDGSTPRREATAEYSYTFSGWSPDVGIVKGDAEYTAQFDAVKNEYTVTWLNEDGSEIKSEQLEYGKTPSYDGDTPTKAATAEYTYTFKGWSPEIVSVTENAEYTAQFNAVKNKYTITWLNEDGSEIKSEQLEYGATPSYDGEEPTKAATTEYTYTFKGWSPEIVSVTENADYTAQFNAVKNKYTITWLNDDGSEIKSEQFEYGDTPAYDGETPAKAATAEYAYTFSGWSPDILKVTGDVTYTAQYTSTKILQKPKFSVTDSDDGKIIAIIEGGSEDNPDFYYTTDGAAPSIESNHYTGEFAIYESATIKAVAVKEGCVTSEVAMTEVTVEPQHVVQPDGDILETNAAINYTNGALQADIEFVNAGTEIPQEEASDLEQFCVIIAVYGNNHQLIGLSIGDTGLEKLSAGLTLTANVSEDEDISEVRMLIWNNTIEMHPLRDAKILTK